MCRAQRFQRSRRRLFFVLGIFLSLACVSGLWSQDQPSTSLPSSPAIDKLKQDLKQLQDLKLQMQNYQTTWQALTPALQQLLLIETRDNASLTALTNQLNNLGADSQEVSTLSTKLSNQFKTLSLSYSMDKLIVRIAVPVTIVSVIVTVVSFLTKGFTTY